jgi:hypothetical protein
MLEHWSMDLSYFEKNTNEVFTIHKAITVSHDYGYVLTMFECCVAEDTGSKSLWSEEEGCNTSCRKCW